MDRARGINAAGAAGFSGKVGVIAMGKFERVRYLRVNRMSLEIVAGLGAAEKAQYMDQLFAWFLQLERGEEVIQGETGNPVLDLALREALGELEAGYEQYMRNVNARKINVEPAEDQRSITDEPAIDQRSITDTPAIDLSDQSGYRSIRSILTQTEINQIKESLLASGYSAFEIDIALDRTTDKKLSNPTGYLRRILENNRKNQKPAGKTVTAQQYNQRPYGEEDFAAEKKFINAAIAASGF